MSTTTLRWALIGASDIAATRMLPALRALGHTAASVVSGDADRARQWAEQHGVPRSGTDLVEGLQDVDAVYISSTNTRHHEQALTAIRARRHVLCEKPLALTARECDELVAEAEEAGVILATNHHLPGSPLHVKARELVTSGRIGDLLAARVMHAVELPERLRTWRLSGDEAQGSGVILDITCHDASVLNPLFGGLPEQVSALAVRQNTWAQATADAPDAVMTVLRYPGPDGRARLAQTHDAFTVPQDTTRLEILGSSGTIVVHDAMTQEAAGSITLITAAGTEDVAVDTDLDLYQIVLGAFGRAVAGTGAPTASGRDGANTVRVALAVAQAARTGTAVDPRDVP